MAQRFVWCNRSHLTSLHGSHLNFDMKTVGKGRVGIARSRWSDPYKLAMDAHLLRGRRHDVLRLWNPGSVLSHNTQSPAGDRAGVQLISYSTREASPP